MMEESDLKVAYKGGATFVAVKPVFSTNNQFLFTASKNLVISYNTKTSKQYLEYTGCKNDIVGIGIYVENGVDFITACSTSGEFIVWNINTGLNIRQITEIQTDVRGSIVAYKILKQGENYKAAFMAVRNRQAHFSVYDFEEQFVKQIHVITFRGNDVVVDFGGTNEFISIALGVKRRLHYVRLRKGENKREVFSYLITGDITCVACHPEIDCVLTGDHIGRVCAWFNLQRDINIPSVFHWHTLPVRTVCFSPTGNYFYSGGSECVMVKWNINNQYETNFLPRCSSYIDNITVASNNMFVAVAANDNCIYIANPELDTLSEIRKLQFVTDETSGMCYDARTKSVVVNGTIGHLHFYIPHTLQEISKLDIVDVNKMTDEREFKADNINVTAFALHQNCNWIATVEQRNDYLNSDSRLKFWKLYEQRFVLNTNIEYPHNGKTTNIKFQPSNKRKSVKCISMGTDNLFRIWELFDTSTIYKKRQGWQCLCAGYYKELAPQGLSFSLDGTLLAVGFGEILTAWQPDSCELKCSLVHSKHKETIRFIEFGTGLQCHLIVTASDHFVNVWNLLTLNMVWTVPLKVKFLIADTLSTAMAVFTLENAVHVFEPLSPKPLYSNRNLLPDEKPVVSAVFIPNRYRKSTDRAWYNSSQLYFIDTNREVHCLEQDVIDVDDDEIEQLDVNDITMSSFAKMLPAKMSKMNAKQDVVKHTYSKASKQRGLNEFLDTPVHTMRTLFLYCNPILSEIIKRKLTDDKDLITAPKNEAVKEVEAANDESLIDDFSKIALEPLTWIKEI